MIRHNHSKRDVKIQEGMLSLGGLQREKHIPLSDTKIFLLYRFIFFKLKKILIIFAFTKENNGH